MKSLLVLGAAAPAATQHGPLQRELSAHREVKVEEHVTKQRLSRSDREEVFTAHRVGGHEEAPQQARVASLSSELVRDSHCLPEPGNLARDRVELRASDDGKVAGPHATAETGDEVAAARDDKERALRGIVDRDRHTLRSVR